MATLFCGVWYGFVILPRARTALGPLMAGGASLLLLCLSAALLGFLLALLPRPVPAAMRSLHAAGGLGLHDEYRLARASFVLRNAVLAFLVFLLALPAALACPQGRTLAALAVALVPGASWPFSAALAFALRSRSLGASSPDHGRRARSLASWVDYLSQDEGRRLAFHPRLGPRTAIFLESLARNKEAILLVGLSVLLEFSAARDFHAWAAEPGADLGAVAGRGRAATLFCSALASVALIPWLAREPRLFLRLQSTGSLAWVRERWLPPLCLAWVPTAILPLSLAPLMPRELPFLAAFLMLPGLVAAALGESIGLRQGGRTGPASTAFLLAAIVLAFVSMTRAWTVLAILVLAAALASALYAARFRFMEVSG